MGERGSEGRLGRGGDKGQIRGRSRKEGERERRGIARDRTQSDRQAHHKIA